VTVRRTGRLLLAGAVVSALAAAFAIAGASAARRSGWWALGLLLLTLAASPLRRALAALGRRAAAVHVHRARRGLGLAAAAAGAYHLLEALEHHFGAAAPDAVLASVLAIPWLRHGALALALLALLALTSLTPIARRLAAWSALHRAIYAAVLFAGLHALLAPHAGLPAWLALVLAALLLAARLLPAPPPHAEPPDAPD
jgi:sulfoxide reductase heme-binding subunit YedZ